MQFPEQPPAEEQPGQPGQPDREPMASEFQPFYEFPPDISSQIEASATPNMQQVQSGTEQTEQTGQTGSSLSAPPESIYPPPPSYYQNMIIPSPQAVHERMSAHPVTQAPNRNMPPSSPPYPSPADIPPAIWKPPTKKSYAWVWLLVSILSVLVLVGCGAFGWLLYTISSSTVQQITGSLAVVNEYYGNLQSKNYAAAYSDLALDSQSTSNLTQDQFVQQATARDAQYGPVLSYTAGTPSYDQTTSGNTNLSSFSIIVHVKRTSLNYDVLLHVKQINGNGKITNFDQI